MKKIITEIFKIFCCLSIGFGIYRETGIFTGIISALFLYTQLKENEFTHKIIHSIVDLLQKIFEINKKEIKTNSKSILEITDILKSIVNKH